MDESFNWFLIAYVSLGHNINHSAIAELNELTNEYLVDVEPNDYFKSDVVIGYIDYIKENMSKHNKRFFILRFNKWRYIQFLESWIQTLIKSRD